MKNNDYGYEYEYEYEYEQRSDSEYTSPGPGPQNGGRPPQGDNFRDGISWGVDIALIFLWFPVGLALTIAHGLGVDIVGKILQAFGRKGAARKAGEKVREDVRQSREKAQEKAREREEEPAAAEPALRRADNGAKVKTVFGWILAAFGLLGAVASGGSGIWAVLTWLAVALGGGSLLVSAGMSRRKEKQFRQCMKVTGETGLVDIGKLGRTMGWKGVEAERVLSDMIDRGYFGPRAYIDHERGLLVIRPEDMRDVYRAEDMAAQARKEQQAQARSGSGTGDMTEYERIVEAIRQADVDIDDEVMSEKIRRMQTVTEAIFREVEAHPEKRSQIDRFLNYYLPTTLKLLDNYARIEEQGVTGANMAKAKADIEGIADTLVAGYEKQLDMLYRAEAMDIAGDVSVIENMMRRDGLAGAKDFAPGGETETQSRPQTMGGH